MPWEEFAPWHPDPNESLRQLQSQYVCQNYNLPVVLRDALEDTRQAIQGWQSDGDPFDLLAGDREKHAWLEATLKSPLPTDPWQQVLIIRRLYSDTGQGIGNVLDVEGISQEPEPLRARPLKEEELTAIFGASHPTRDVAPKALAHLADSIGRGESICFPVYDADRVPIGWWFAGYTID